MRGIYGYGYGIWYMVYGIYEIYGMYDCIPVCASVILPLFS